MEITCIEIQGAYTDNPHQAIISFGYVNHDTNASGKMSHAMLLQYINNGQPAYIKTPAGDTASIVAHSSPSGQPFLIAYLDGHYTDDLLNLARCK